MASGQELAEQAAISEKACNYSRAIDLWREAMAAEPDDPSYPHHLGQLFMRLKAFPQAAEAWAQSLELDPRHTVTRFMYAKALAYAGMYERALLEIDKVIKANPDKVTAIILKHRLLVLDGRKAAARDFFKHHGAVLGSRTDQAAQAYLDWLDAPKSRFERVPPGALGKAVSQAKRRGSGDEPIRKYFLGY